MSKQRFTLSFLLVLALLVPGVILAQPAAPQVTPVPEPLGSSALFIENAGQWPDAARFQVWVWLASVGTTWLANDANPDHDLSNFFFFSHLHPSPLSFEERGEGPGERGEGARPSTSNSPSPAPTRASKSSRSTR